MILPSAFLSLHCEMSPAMCVAPAPLRLATTTSEFRPTVVRDGSLPCALGAGAVAGDLGHGPRVDLADRALAAVGDPDDRRLPMVTLPGSMTSSAIRRGRWCRAWLRCVLLEPWTSAATTCSKTTRSGTRGR